MVGFTLLSGIYFLCSLVAFRVKIDMGKKHFWGCFFVLVFSFMPVINSARFILGCIAKLILALSSSLLKFPAPGLGL